MFLLIILPVLHPRITDGHSDPGFLLPLGKFFFTATPSVACFIITFVVSDKYLQLATDSDTQ